MMHTLLGAAIAAGFDPSSYFLAGREGVWGDPSDMSKLWKDTARTIPATAAGDLIKGITDKSGRGHHMTNATGWVLATAGGLWWLVADGLSGWQTINTIDLTASDKLTAWFGLDANNTGNQGLFQSGGGVGYWSVLYTAHNVRTQMTGTAATSERFTTGGVTGKKVYSFGFDFAGALAADESNTRINATEASYAASGAGAGAGPINNSALAVGEFSGLFLAANTKVFGWIVRGGASSAGERADGETWMNGKTGAY